MESFASKVRYGDAPRFDSMLKKKGGWISREAQQKDVEIEDFVLEGLAETTQQISSGDLNPFKGQCGEILPSNLERSCSGFFSAKGCC